MTPTEQDKELEQWLDKLSELNKLGGRGHGDLADTCHVCGISPSKLLAYITADRKRVALEARIDERQMLNFHRAYGRDYQATLETLEESNDERIAELKAQQEEAK